MQKLTTKNSMSNKTFVVIDQETGEEYYAAETEEAAAAALVELVDAGIAAYMIVE